MLQFPFPHTTLASLRKPAGKREQYAGKQGARQVARQQFGHTERDPSGKYVVDCISTKRAMSKTMALIAIGVVVALVSTIGLQHEQNREVARELERVRQEKTNLEALQAAPAPEQRHVQSGDQPNQQELESELIRLRGAASRATRAEAESAQLRLEIDRLRAQANGNATPGSQNADTLSAYLGAPVETPSAIDAAYTKEGLSAAIQTAAQKAGVSLKRVGVDYSEFPYLTGVISEPGDWEKLKTQLSSMEGYEYHGSVGDDTSHTFCIIPTHAFPAGAGQRVSRRLNVRMQLYYDSFTAGQN